MSKLPLDNFNEIINSSKISLELSPITKKELFVNGSAAPLGVQPTRDDNSNNICICTEFMKRDINYLICNHCKFNDELVSWKKKDQFIFDVFCGK